MATLRGNIEIHRPAAAVFDSVVDFEHNPRCHGACVRVTRAVEPLGDAHCRVEATIEGGPGGALRLLSPLTTLLAQRSVRDDYARLKRLLESPADRED